MIRINLALGAVFIAATLIAGYACRTILEANARREGIRGGRSDDGQCAGHPRLQANEILPLLRERIQEEFPPQSVPSYAATQNFLRLRERHIVRA
jgi:hypothetical protein